MPDESVLNGHKIILFDGVCNLCNDAVLFVIKRDKNQVFRYAALQSEAGMRLLKLHKVDITYIDSFVLFENHNMYIKSSAALRMAKSLRFPWPLLYAFIIVPKFIRDAVYDYIARNRYKWFGKRDVCIVPTPELQGLFLN